MKTSYAITLVLTLTVLTSCASPYIGRSVKMGNPAVCVFSSLPASCTWVTDDFNLDYKIETTGNINEYKISGKAVATGGSSKTFTDYSNASFTLLLVNDQKVAATFRIAGGQGSLDGDISFSRTFKYDDSMEAALMAYFMDVRG